MEIQEKVNQVVFRPFLVKWEAWKVGLLTYKLFLVSIKLLSLETFSLLLVFLCMETQRCEVFFDGEMSVVLRG